MPWRNRPSNQPVEFTQLHPSPTRPMAVARDGSSDRSNGDNCVRLDGLLWSQVEHVPRGPDGYVPGYVGRRPAPAHCDLDRPGTADTPEAQATAGSTRTVPLCVKGLVVGALKE